MTPGKIMSLTLKNKRCLRSDAVATSFVCFSETNDFSVIVPVALSFSLVLFPKGWLSHYLPQGKRKNKER
jgi:hypothetical protein